MSTVLLAVKGMTCAGCVRSVENVLRAIDGVAGVHVSLEQGSARVEYDAARTDSAALRSAVEAAGYEAV